MELLLAQVVVTETPLWLRTLNAVLLVLEYAPYWGPPVLGVAFWRAWMRYVRARFIASQPMVLLELKLPQEVFKSPAAMRAVLDGLHLTGGESTFIDRIWLGKVRQWYSFELVSMEGQAHFYVWCRAAFKRHVERNFYAHYPDLEINEVPDYVTQVDARLDTHDWTPIDYRFSQPDPLPIKAYVDYGLDQSSLKEEQKTDPLVGILETLGSMGKGEYLWIQMLMRPHKKEDITYGGSAGMRNTKTLDQQADAYISKIRQSPEETIIFQNGLPGKTLSQTQLDQIKAIHRTVRGSNHYDGGIRALYLAEREVFDGTTIPAMIRLFAPYNASGYNQIIPNFNRWTMPFDYPWQDYKGMRENRQKIRGLDAYRRRSWFHDPYKFKHFGFTTEEIATLFHPVGSVARTPTLQRISSTRSEAPANLPL